MKRKTCIFKNVAMLFIAIGLLAVFVGCNDKNDEVGPLREEVQTLRSDLTKSFDAKVDAKTGELQKQVDDLKARLTELSNKKTGVSAEELESVKKQIIELTVAKTAFEEYKESVKAKIEAAVTVADLNTLKDKIESVESRIAALETLVGKNKSALDKALADLKTEFKGALDGQIAELQSQIANNKSDLVSMLDKYKELANKSDANATAIETLNNNLAELERKMNIGVVNAMLNSRLTSLVLLPEYVSDNGGALPVVLFAPLKTQDCGFISPDVEVKYVVSPSTVTANDIDTNNIKFAYNDPKSLEARQITSDNLKAKFVSLRDGVLTVRVVGNLLNETWAVAKTNPDKRIDQLMLQVPSKDGSFVVSSDWAKIKYKDESPAIVKYIENADDKFSVDYLLASTVGEAKNLKLDDLTIVDMAWDKKLDLNTVVKSVYSNWTEFNPNTYGLDFSFDLKDEKGNVIEYPEGPKNKTDQQEFINLNGSIVSTRVFGKEANRSAIGRTPIVHVMLKKGDCLVKEGFIKLNIVEKEIVPVPPVVYKGSYEAKCGKNELYRVKTKTMNEDFYHKANMSKEEFHANYTFKQLALNPSDSTNVGTISQVKDLENTDSYNLIYTLTEDEVWNNIGKTVWAEAVYTYGSGPRASEIKVKFEVEITKETVNLDVLIRNYWYQDSTAKKSDDTGVYNTVVHNVAVPVDGDINSDNATFENNINNAFVVIDKKTNNELNLNNKLTPADKYKGYTYEYIFDEKQPELVRGKGSVVDGIKVYVNPDNNKQLLAKKGSAAAQVIAEIEPQSKTEGDVLSYKEDSELGKYLLNKGPEFMKARVVLVVKNKCKKRVNVVVKDLEDKDRFNVNFLRPINVKEVSGEFFVDAVDFGKKYTYIDMKKVAKLSDWRKGVKGTDKYDFLPNNENYYDYYGIKNIKVNGKIRARGLNKEEIKDLKKVTNVDVTQTPNNEVFNGETYRYGRLTYDNNGNNLGKNFTIIVPIVVEYKWGKILETEVEIDVKATSTDARKRVK